MADTRVTADFQEGSRVIFTARDRATVNVRAASSDGTPIGFTSSELLLIALANCTLGTVQHHDSLAGIPVRGLRAVLECTTARAPSHFDDIKVRVELDVDEGALTERQSETLQRVADACPVGNTLKLPTSVSVQLVINGQPVGAVAPATGD
jgi:uncharacterized OsmC-like protein